MADTLRKCLQAVAPALGLDPRRFTVGSVVAVPGSVLAFGQDRSGGRVPRVALVAARKEDGTAVLLPGTTHYDYRVPSVPARPGDGSGVHHPTWFRCAAAEPIPGPVAARLHVIGSVPDDALDEMFIRVFGRKLEG